MMPQRPPSEVGGLRTTSTPWLLARVGQDVGWTEAVVEPPGSWWSWWGGKTQDIKALRWFMGNVDLSMSSTLTKKNQV